MLVTVRMFSELKGQGFSKDVCRSMIAMLDKDNSGGLGFEEFKSLWIDLRNWRVSIMNVFRRLLQIAAVSRWYPFLSVFCRLFVLFLI